MSILKSTYRPFIYSEVCNIEDKKCSIAMYNCIHSAVISDRP